MSEPGSGQSLDATPISKSSIILDLPPEVLSRVFECYVQSHAAFDSMYPLQNEPNRPWAQSPFLLGQVSRQLRAIALDTPTLWTYMELRGDDAAVAPGRLLAYAATIAERSGAASLEVSVFGLDKRADRSVLLWLEDTFPRDLLHRVTRLQWDTSVNLGTQQPTHDLISTLR